MVYKDVMCFTLLLWVSCWSGESECCTCTYVIICSLVVMENWLVNYCIFSLRTYFETKSIVQLQRYVQHESNIPRHGRIPSHNAVLKLVDDFDICNTVVNKFVGPIHCICTPENIEQMRGTVQPSPVR
jgi:hypothetical protein